ncbi:unnamed protein product [Arabidopsis thaliana]|uniref:(thale cress) hypothetical protein n=1 Tax=Arabidopsis thaliana TaxID=3702 RepID=A0A7G2DYY0_ARATH|nr:unnamed protein product [Arabidopsis thaliana]
MMSQSSGSDANSVSRSWGPLCNCGKGTTITKAWTIENPGRRFFRCGVHGFINWADEEKPCGWQKQSLLEARDEIRQLKESLKVMKEQLVTLSGSPNIEDLISPRGHKEDRRSWSCFLRSFSTSLANVLALTILNSRRTSPSTGKIDHVIRSGSIDMSLFSNPPR